MHHRPLIQLSLAACLVLVSGCASWRVPTYDFSKLRDPRAVDIDSRLASPPPTGGSHAK